MNTNKIYKQKLFGKQRIIKFLNNLQKNVKKLTFIKIFNKIRKLLNVF